MDGIDRVDRRPPPPDADPNGQVGRRNAKQTDANTANNPWLPAFVENVPIKYPATLLSAAAPPAGPKPTLASTAEEIVRLQRAKPPADAAKIRELQGALVAQAHAAGLKEPSASFSPWTASDAELGSAFLFTHAGGVLPLDAARHDGGVRFREDIFEAVALRTRGLDDAVIDSYAGDPGTQRVLLERELRRLGDASQCKTGESIDDLRLRRAKLVNAVQTPEADRRLYIGLDGKVGTFDALVEYELEQRILASNPGTTLGAMTATVAAVRGGDTNDIRAAGALGNGVQNVAGAAAGFDQKKIGTPAPVGDIRGRRRELPSGPGLGRRTRSAGGEMPRRAQAQNAPTATTATATQSRTPMGLNDKHLGGEVRNGRAVGFHHEPSANGRSRLVAGTETKPDAHGIYEARVQVRGHSGDWVMKATPSTFFPKHWSRPEVRTAILEAYANRRDLGDGNWSGKTASGVTIRGHSDHAGVIDSAYPLKETP